MLPLPLLRPSGEHHSLDRQPVVAVDGSPLAEVHMAPAMLMPRVVDELRDADDDDQGHRLAVLSRAGELFETATVGGQTPEGYSANQARCSGVPVNVVRRSLGRLRDETGSMAETVAAQRPRGTRRVEPVAGPTTANCDAAAAWVQKARVLGVIAPSNHPATHAGWLQALALGYRVAVRPGRRDVFTPWRLAHSLFEAGLRRGALAILPGTHAAADALVEAVDLALVYGNESTVERYRGAARVMVRGPGRSKILVDDALSDTTLDFLADAVAADAGVRCTNASAILVAGDHVSVAEALAERLARLPSLPPTDKSAVLPVLPAAEARAVRAWLDARLDGATDLVTERGGGPVADLGDGTAALRPAVITSDRLDHPHLGTELPFPCVWVGPWCAKQGLGPLKRSLAVTLLTANETLVRSALVEPSIRRVLWGPVPAWSSGPGLPHDGHLGQFLMEAKAFAVHQ